LKNPYRILCAVDASRPATAAFEQALAMSVRRGAQLVLVHAVSKDRAYSRGAVERMAALAALRERAEALKVSVRVRVQQGDTAGVILLHARAHAPDLIVLGFHEPVGLARFRFHSIAERVVKGATCNVLLVPAGTTPVTPFRNIVCAVDLSSRSPAMITKVADIAEAGERLTFVHVLHHAVRRGGGRFAVSEFAPATARDTRHRLQSMLDTQGVTSDVLVAVTSMSTEAEILRVARETKADLIVMGATRSAGLRRRFRGATALRVSHRSPIPVLILPARQVMRTLSTLDQTALGWAA
jgi:nucleotide-binding universal stress UspA family protein